MLLLRASHLAQLPCCCVRRTLRTRDLELRQRMPDAERDAALTVMTTAAAAETRAALGLGAAKARKGEDAGLLAELAALMAKGGSMTPAEAARSKELMVLLKGPKAQGVSN